MNHNLSYMANKLLIFIFLTFPFWEIITAQFGYFLHIPFTFLGVLKYTILIILIGLLGVNLLKKRFIINADALFILMYVIYISLHFIGSSHLLLKVDGFRYEVLFPLISFLLLGQQSLKIIKIEIFIKIICIQGFIIFFVAFYEYFNQEILITLYRKSLEEIPHITWFSLNRLISTVGNPINLGASLIIWIISLFYFVSITKSKLLKYSLPIIVLMTFFLVTMTLSRTSLITFVSIVVFFMLMGVDTIKSRMYIITMIGLLIILLFTYVIQTINIDLIIQRFGNLFDSNEYSENARVINWSYAISTFENFEYFWGKGLGASTPNGEYVELYGGLMVESGFISIIINYGIIGFILFCIIFIRFFIISIFILKRNKSFGIFLILFLITYSLYNLANDYNRNLPYVLYFWIFYYYAEINYKKLYTNSNNVL